MEARQWPGLLVARLQQQKLSSTEEFASCRKPNLGMHRVHGELEMLRRLERLDNVDKDRQNTRHDYNKSGNDANEAKRMLNCSPMTLKSTAYQRLEAAFSMTWM